MSFVRQFLRSKMAAIPSRYRPWLKALTVAFLIFEAWRALLIGAALFPIWKANAMPMIENMAHYARWEIAVGTAVAFIAFVAPMAGVVYALRRFGRAASVGSESARSLASSVPRPFRALI